MAVGADIREEKTRRVPQAKPKRAAAAKPKSTAETPEVEPAPSAIGQREPWKAFQARQRSMVSKREAVLRTAAHLFLVRGYQRSSMTQLAAQLKITKPALYYYFRNKEEILVECYRAGIADIEAILTETSENQGTGLRKLFLYVETYTIAIVSGEFGRCVAMLDETELSPSTRREVRTMKRRLDMTLRGYVEEGIEDGSIAPCNPKLVSFAIAGAINWIGSWYRPDGALTPCEIAAEYARIITRGLEPRAGTQGSRPPQPA